MASKLWAGLYLQYEHPPVACEPRLSSQDKKADAWSLNCPPASLSSFSLLAPLATCPVWALFLFFSDFYSQDPIFSKDPLNSVSFPLFF